MEILMASLSSECQIFLGGMVHLWSQNFEWILSVKSETWHVAKFASDDEYGES